VIDATVDLLDRPAVFTEGSTLRHVAVLTATGTASLMAIFVVDLLSLFYVSRLDDETLKAAVGYASQVLFLSASINIGLSIATSAVTAHALGAGDRRKARRLAASGLVLTTVVSALVAFGLFAFRESILGDVLHARGPVRDVVDRYLAIVLPANIPFAVGMSLSGLLRAVGDSRRAMFVALAGALVTAAADPLLIFGAGLGVYGAAWATLISRFVLLGVGVYGAHFVHGIVDRPVAKAVVRDLAPIMAIGGPTIIANLASPAAAVYTTRVLADFGDAAIAAIAIIDRIVPVAFGVIFALASSIGPVLSQNVGATLMHRVQSTLTESFLLSIAYVLAAWAIVFAATPSIVAAFRAEGESAQYLAFFCAYGVSAWAFLACLFVASAAFVNLGAPLLAALFNWGRATLGTIPFVAFGAKLWGVEGGMMGASAGAAVFGLSAMAVAYWVAARLTNRLKKNASGRLNLSAPGGAGRSAAAR
jgi:putative MATE family efflux protein